jgi:ParB family chromosome partitioning protein
VALDMTAHWTPTVRTYLGRVTKAQILAAVREAVGEDAAEQIADKKKQEMAEKAEPLLAGTGWLPIPLRTEPPAWLAYEQPQAPAVADAMPEAESAGTMEDEPFAVAAE